MGDSLMDLNDRCRLCIEPKRLSIDIFSEEGRRIKLKSKINKNLPLKVSQSDGLPSQICYQCLFRLETWVSFKQLCMERDQVMKTWSQSYQDGCGRGGVFDGEKKNCKTVKVREPIPTQAPRNTVFTADSCTLSNQVDDTKSDTSVWEVVKADDSDNVDCETHDKEYSLNQNSNADSADLCNASEDIPRGKLDLCKSKSKNLNKMSTSSSDLSNCSDLLTFSSENQSEAVDGFVLTIGSTARPKKSPSVKQSSETSPVPLKRKRGRPSKASLQRERELKRMKELRKIKNDNLISSAVEQENADCGKNHEDFGEEVDISGDARLHSRSTEFMPVERDGGSGITEVVLDDPDFGSMKFTLSVVDVESPTSSPIPTDGYKYFSYASSTGNLSSDSLQREDFEGFESPCTPNNLKIPAKDEFSSSSEELSRPTSQTDVGCLEKEDITPLVGDERKHFNSEFAGIRENCPSSPDMSLENHKKPLGEEITVTTFLLKKRSASQSFENPNLEDGDSELMKDPFADRNAYSDGELSESPKKKMRRKSFN